MHKTTISYNGLTITEEIEKPPSTKAAHQAYLRSLLDVLAERFAPVVLEKTTDNILTQQQAVPPNGGEVTMPRATAEKLISSLRKVSPKIPVSDRIPTANPSFDPDPSQLLIASAAYGYEFRITLKQLGKLMGVDKSADDEDYDDYIMDRIKHDEVFRHNLRYLLGER